MLQWFTIEKLSLVVDLNWQRFTPIEVCEQRDSKGLYKKAREGKLPNFSGISIPYEAPSNTKVRTDGCQNKNKSTSLKQFLKHFE